MATTPITLTPAPMAMAAQPMDRMAALTGELPTIPTPEPMPVERQHPLLTATQSVGQAYNPYTGAYGATHQGSNAYGSWGQSVVSKNGNTAYTQHATNAYGSAGTVRRRMAARVRLPALHTATPRQEKPPTATCMPATTATFIRTPVQAGRSTTTAAGTTFRSQPQLRHRAITSNIRPAAIQTTPRPSRKPRATPTILPISRRPRVTTSNIRRDPAAISRVADPLTWTRKRKTAPVVLSKASASRSTSTLAEAGTAGEAQAGVVVGLVAGDSCTPVLVRGRWKLS